MASVSTNAKTGIHRIQFTTRDGIRRTLQVGSIPKTEARKIAKHIAHLIRCSKTTEEPKADTAAWVADIRQSWQRIADKLHEWRLIGNGARLDAGFAAFTQCYIATRRGVKPNTVRVWRQTSAKLKEFFGERTLQELTVADAKSFAEWLTLDKEQQTVSGIAGAGLAKASAGKHLGFAKQFANAAIDAEIITKNPFDKVVAPPRKNKARQRFVDRDTIRRVLEMTPDAEMRLIIVLSRFAGLRVPSEPFALRWQDIDWKRNRVTVRSPKTEHHAGHESREIPLFPELVPALLDVQEQAETGSEFVIVQRRSASDAALRKRMYHLIRKAGVPRWPRVFHNLRSSRQTELEERFPSHVVCQWLGNSEQVSRDHYLQTLGSHFEQALVADAEQATQKATQQSQELAGSGVKTANTSEANEPSESPALSCVSQGFASVSGWQSTPPTGVEGNRTLPAAFQPPQRV